MTTLFQIMLKGDFWILNKLIYLLYGHNFLVSQSPCHCDIITIDCNNEI